MQNKRWNFIQKVFLFKFFQGLVWFWKESIYFQPTVKTIFHVKTGIKLLLHFNPSKIFSLSNMGISYFNCKLLVWAIKIPINWRIIDNTVEKQCSILLQLLSAVTASIFTVEKYNKSKDRRKTFLVNSLSLPFRTSFISEMKFGVETGKGKSYAEDIKKQN